MFAYEAINWRRSGKSEKSAGALLSVFFAREMAGAACTRRSLRLLIRRKNDTTWSGHRAADSEWLLKFETLHVIARSVSDEAIHSFFVSGMDCFAEPVIGRAFARPVGSQ